MKQLHHFYSQMHGPEYPSCTCSTAQAWSYSGWLLCEWWATPCTMVFQSGSFQLRTPQYCLMKGSFRMQSDMSSELLPRFILCLYAAFIKQWCNICLPHPIQYLLPTKDEVSTEILGVNVRCNFLVLICCWFWYRQFNSRQIHSLQTIFHITLTHILQTVVRE